MSRWTSRIRRCLATVGCISILAACADGPPDAPPGPVEARDARADDTTAVVLPEAASADFCVAAQQVLASTTLTGSNTLFTDMPEYRHSKPSANPHRVYQVVTYRGAIPVAVSCKVKTAAHLRAVYGPQAAGAQQSCAELTRRAVARAVAALESEGSSEAAQRAVRFAVDENEPYLTGRDYLADFELSYVAADGTVHLSSPGLFQNYDSWITQLLPWQVRGQHYCHLPTVDYVKALASGSLQPGTVMSTADDAPVTPR